MLTETALVAAATLFATVGPVDCAVLFAAITPKNTPAEKRAMAIKGTLIAFAILLAMALSGGYRISDDHQLDRRWYL